MKISIFNVSFDDTMRYFFFFRAKTSRRNCSLHILLFLINSHFKYMIFEKENSSSSFKIDCFVVNFHFSGKVCCAKIHIERKFYRIFHSVFHEYISWITWHHWVCTGNLISDNRALSESFTSDFHVHSSFLSQKKNKRESRRKKHTHNRRLSLSVAFFIHMKNVAIRMVQLHLPPSTKSLHFIYRYTSFDSVVDAVVLMYPNWILTLGTRITQYTHTSCNLAANSPLILFSFIYILLIYIKCWISSLFSYFTFGFFWELLRTLDATSKNPTRILRILPNARSKHFFHSQKYCLFGNRIFFANWANVNISHLCIKILASTHTVISILSTQ